jgi:hypothetical protein
MEVIRARSGRPVLPLHLGPLSTVLRSISIQGSNWWRGLATTVVRILYLKGLSRHLHYANASAAKTI